MKAKKLEANYGGAVREAEIDLTNGKVLFEGKEYSSPSAAAIAAVNSVKGENYTERYNGYALWNIMYPNGDKKKLSDVRDDIAASLA